MNENLKEQLKRNVEAYLVERNEHPGKSRSAWRKQLIELASLLGEQSIANVKEALKE